MRVYHKNRRKETTFAFSELTFCVSVFLLPKLLKKQGLNVLKQCWK